MIFCVTPLLLRLCTHSPPTSPDYTTRESYTKRTQSANISGAFFSLEKFKIFNTNRELFRSFPDPNPTFHSPYISSSVVIFPRLLDRKIISTLQSRKYKFSKGCFHKFFSCKKVDSSFPVPV